MDLNEKVIIKKLDTQKTYYNSILSEIKPKFRYRRRLRQHMVDSEGNSIHEDVSSVAFSSQLDSMGNLRESSRTKKARASHHS